MKDEIKALIEMAPKVRVDQRRLGNRGRAERLEKEKGGSGLPQLTEEEIRKAREWVAKSEEAKVWAKKARKPRRKREGWESTKAGRQIVRRKLLEMLEGRGRGDEYKEI